MKKCMLILSLLLIQHLTQAQAGRIRVYFAGFECYRETWDDILHLDGKGDEVYFNFGFSLADRNGNSKFKYEKRTAVYGDATGPFSNRISVGSCTDLFGGAKGGIKAGDTYRCNELIGEYDMADGDLLAIIPTGWEYDPVADDLNSFTTTVGNMYTILTQRLAPIVNKIRLVTDRISSLIFPITDLGLSKINAGGLQGELGKAGTRPIGMEKYGNFTPQVAGLTAPNILTLINSNYGYGNGIFAIKYDEVALGNTRDHGIYNILLRIEFTPAPTVPVNTPPSTVPVNNSPATPAFIPSFSSKRKGIAILNNNMPIAGTWKGTWGNGNSNTGYFYSFRLNNDGSLELFDNQGNKTAVGTYQFNNNQLTGTYKYTNGGTFSVKATLSNNQLDGSWGAGTSSDSGGKWIMSKVN